MKQKNKKYEELEWTSEMVSNFWDWQSQYPETYFTFIFGYEIAKSLKKYFINKKVVLDYGCGVGHLIPHLCEFSENVYGTDQSLDSINKTNAMYSNLKSFKGAEISDFFIEKEKKFDVIVAVEIIEHLYDEQLEMLVENVKKLLSENGVVIFTTPNNEDRNQNMIISPETGKLFHRWQHVRSWDKGLLNTYMCKKGFNIVESYTTNLSTVFSFRPKALIKYILNKFFSINKYPHLICVVKLKD